MSDIKIKIQKDFTLNYSLSSSKHKRIQSLNQTQPSKIQIFEESQARLLKPLPNKDFIDLLSKHSQILGQNITEKSKSLALKKLQQTSNNQINDSVTVNDLSQDFMQLINISQNERSNDQKYLLCEIDPKSALHEPIESLRRLLLKESDDEEDEKLSSSSASSDSSNQQHKMIQHIQTKKKRKPKVFKERSDIELYMDSVEQELKKKIGSSSQCINMEIIKHLQDFYQKCFTQLILELAPLNYELKNVANRISNGIDLTFQTLLRHHFVEIQQLQNKIMKQNTEISNLKQQYLYLKNDIKMINRIAPQLCEMIEQSPKKSLSSNQDVSTFTNQSMSKQNIVDAPMTDREKYMSTVQENEEQLQAISQIERMIELRNSHNFQKKIMDNNYNLDKFLPSDAEGSLKNILSDIKSFQDRNMNEIRMAMSLDKDDQEMEHDMQKQKTIIQKDWTGERNSKIKDVQKKLVEIMAIKLDKPKVHDRELMTTARYITEDEFERVSHLNTQFHKQLALNGQLFSIKEKQLDELKNLHLVADLNWKKCDRQLNDIRLLNSVKKRFLLEIKNEYEDIVLEILNICMKFANEIKTQNHTLKEENLDNEFTVQILHAQKKSIEDYLFALIESKKVVNDLTVSQGLQIANKQLKEQIDEIANNPLQNHENRDNPKRKNSRIGESTSESESSTDSVRQVMNSKIEYQNHHIKHFERAKLKQRYSVAPKILKKQILLISQQLEEQNEIRHSNFSHLKGIIEGRRKSSGDNSYRRRMTISHGNSKNMTPNTQELNNDEEELFRSVNIQKDRTIQGHHDDTGLVKNSQPENKMIVSKQDQQALISQKSIAQEVNEKIGYSHQAAISHKTEDPITKKLRQQQEDLDKILNAPVNFEKFVRSQQGISQSKKDGKDAQQIQAEKQFQNSQDNDEVKQQKINEIQNKDQTNQSFKNIKDQVKNKDKTPQKDSKTQAQGSLTEIQEESEDEVNLTTGKVSSKGGYSYDNEGLRGSRYRSKGRQRTGGPQHIADQTTQEIQTDPFLEELTQRINNSMTYLSQVIDSQIDFKTEVQNLSFATKMMSESKINQIRQIFQLIMRKSLSDQIATKNQSIISSQVMSKVQQQINDQNKNSISKRPDSQRTLQSQMNRDDLQKLLNKSDSRPQSRNPISAENPRHQSINTQLSASKLSENQNENMVRIQQMLMSQQQQNSTNILYQNTQLDPSAGMNILNKYNLSNIYKTQVNQQNIQNGTINQGYGIMNQMPINQQSKQLPLKVNIQEKLTQMTNQQTMVDDNTSSMIQSLYETKQVLPQNMNQTFQNQQMPFNLKQNEEIQQQIIKDLQQAQLNNQWKQLSNTNYNFAQFQQNSEPLMKVKSMKDGLKTVQEMNQTQRNQDSGLIQTQTDLSNYNQEVQPTKSRQRSQESKPKQPLQLRTLTPYEQYQVKQIISQGNLSEEQKFYYLRLLQHQLETKKSFNQSTSSNLPISQSTMLKNVLHDNPQQRRRKRSRKQPILEPIQAVKIPIPQQLNQSQRMSYDQQSSYRILNSSKSQGQLLPKINAQTKNSYTINMQELTPAYLLSDSPLAYNAIGNQNYVNPDSINNNKLKPSFTDFNLNQLSQDEQQRKLERDQIFKQIVHTHTEQKKSKDERDTLRYRDRKKSIDDMQKQGNSYQDTISYSKEGRRLDYLPFNL
eukprot:403371385